MKTMYVQPIMMPETLCIDAEDYNPIETTTNFLGMRNQLFRTTVDVTFRPKDMTEIKQLMDFYSKVQIYTDGYFIANVPVFTEEKTYLFRVNETLNNDRLDKKFSVKCEVWCEWEYADGVFDTTPPIITLIGSPTINLELDSEYVDAGATATDNVDGDITDRIVTSGSVDTSTLGTYTITYDVEDISGNKAETVTRVVTIEDVVNYLSNQSFELDDGAWNGWSDTSHGRLAYDDSHDGDFVYQLTDANAGVEQDVVLSDYSISSASFSVYVKTENVSDDANIILSVKSDFPDGTSSAWETTSATNSGIWEQLSIDVSYTQNIEKVYFTIQFTDGTGTVYVDNAILKNNG